MRDFNHGHIQWESLENPGGDDHQFLLHRIHQSINVSLFGYSFTMLLQVWS